MAERQSALVSKITNDGLTRYGIGHIRYDTIVEFNVDSKAE